MGEREDHGAVKEVLLLDGADGEVVERLGKDWLDLVPALDLQDDQSQEGTEQPTRMTYLHHARASEACGRVVLAVSRARPLPILKPKASELVDPTVEERERLLKRGVEPVIDEEPTDEPSLLLVLDDSVALARDEEETAVKFERAGRGAAGAVGSVGVAERRVHVEEHEVLDGAASRDREVLMRMTAAANATDECADERLEAPLRGRLQRPPVVHLIGEMDEGMEARAPEEKPVKAPSDEARVELLEERDDPGVRLVQFLERDLVLDKEANRGDESAKVQQVDWAKVTFQKCGP